MWLISGGAYQGKLEYVLSKKKIPIHDIIDGETCIFQDLLEKPMINHFHLWVKRMLLEKEDVARLVDQILLTNPDIIIIVNELGCGIVPVDAFDREYRETMGRICCRLAQDATQVHRVMCGMGMVIKDA